MRNKYKTSHTKEIPTLFPTTTFFLILWSFFLFLEKLDSFFPFILYLLDSDFLNLKKKSVLQDGFFSPYCEDSQFSLLENFSGLGYFFNWVKSVFLLEEEDLQFILAEKI